MAAVNKTTTVKHSNKSNILNMEPTTVKLSDNELDFFSKSEDLNSIKGGCIDPNPVQYPKSIKELLEELLRPVNYGCSIH